MKQRLARSGIVLALALIVVVFGGCGTVGIVIADGPPAGPPAEPGRGPDEAPGQQGRALPGGQNNVW